MPNATLRPNTRPMPKPKSGSVESIRRQTAELKSSVALLKAAEVVERELAEPKAVSDDPERLANDAAFDRAYSRWLAALAKWHNPDGMDDETAKKRGEELKNAEREVVFTPATESDRVWEKIHVLSLCLDEESTLGPRADHFSLLALAAIKADLLRLGIGREA
jgi:hypothetical protein